MSKEYPHIRDAKFPNIDNVDTYKYKNEFNYTRWSDNVTITLCNVRWRDDYENVVHFASKTARDKYFDDLTGAYKLELKTMFSFFSKGEIKIPLPESNAILYNYCYIDVPIQTSDSEPIKYAKNMRVARLYYFVNKTRYLAPNTTELTLTLDVWNNFFNDCKLNNARLARGHYALKRAQTPYNYLGNPMANSAYLLADDVNFGSNTNAISNSARFIPIQNDNKLLVLFLKCNLDDVYKIGEGVAVNQNTKPTFANLIEDNTIYEDVVVNDYLWNFGGFEYINNNIINAPANTTDGTVPNNACAIAMQYTSAYNFFRTVQTSHAHFYHLIICACVIAEDALVLSDNSQELFGAKVWSVKRGVERDVNISLSLDDFNFAERYKKLTKLYTYPYSYLEVTNNEGQTMQVRIEDTGDTFGATVFTSLALPYLNTQVWLNGVRGSGSNSYNWHRLDALEVREIQNADFGEYLFNYNIPTFAIYANDYDMYVAENYMLQQAQRQNAITSHTNSTYTANVNANNSFRSLGNTSDVAHKNALTSRDNSNDSASNAEINANNTAATVQTNQNNTIRNNYSNTNANTDLNVFLQQQSNALSTQVMGLSNAMNTANQAYDAGASRATTQTTNETNTLNASLNQTASVIDNVTGGWGGFLMGFGGAVSQSVGGPIGDVISSVTSAPMDTATGLLDSMGYNFSDTPAGTTTYLVAQKDSDLTETLIEYSDQKTKATNRNNLDINNAQVSSSTTCYTQGASVARQINSNNSDTAKTNATNNYNNSVSVATNNKFVSNKITDRNYSNQWNEDTADLGVIQRNFKTGYANSAESRNYSVLVNSRATLENTQNSARMEYERHKSNAPREIGYTNAGDLSGDAYMRKGLQIKIKRQQDDAIIQTGDYWLRYGYACDRIIELPIVLQMMKYFTFWQFVDIDIYATTGIAGRFVEIIKDILIKGVTIWTQPDMIGGVSIYDN